MQRLGFFVAKCMALALLSPDLSACPQDAPPVLAAEKLEDGPHLFHRSDGSVDAVWIEAGKKKTKRFAKGAPIELPRFAELLGESLRLQPHEPDPAVFDLPQRMLVISDVEGEYDSLVRFLRANGVIDDRCRWVFGKHHLVAVGDMVDRGDQVTEVLWLMYRLRQQAKAAGGRVHFVLGNHEAMIMGGDVRYIAEKYKKVSAAIGLPYTGLVGADTEIGRWLRARNAVVRVGRFLFVHGGVAPTLKVKADQLDAFNRRIRAGLGIPPRELVKRYHAAVAAKDEKGADAASAAWHLLWGTRGPFWYRGYFRRFAIDHPEDFGPVPTVAQMDGVVTRLAAKTIVVGHTKVKRPTFLFGRRVLAMDTPWTDIDNVRGLWVEDGRLGCVDVKGRKSWVGENGVFR